MKFIKLAKSLILPISLVITVLMRDGFVMPWNLFWFIAAFIVAYFVSGIFHEFAHFIFFKKYGLSIMELSFGLFRVFFIEDNIKALFTPDLPFDALCSCKGLRNISRYKQRVCLLSGGFANLLVAVILVIVFFVVEQQLLKILIGVQMTACVANMIINVVNPHSKDRKLLRKLNKTEDV
jgi:hypothetical protein